MALWNIACSGVAQLDSQSRVWISPAGYHLKRFCGGAASGGYVPFTVGIKLIVYGRGSSWSWFSSQGAANQFEMWLGESLFVLVLAKRVSQSKYKVRLT